MGENSFQHNYSGSVAVDSPTVEQQSFAQLGLEGMSQEQPIRRQTRIDEMLLGITREEMPRVSVKQADMVSRQYLSHLKDAMVTIRPDGIQFNNSCIAKMPDTYHIQLFIDRSKKYLIIKACDEFDKDGQRWCSEKNGKRQSRKITGRPFSEKLYKMMSWSKGYYYKVCGTPALQEDDEDELLFVFELQESDRYALSAKGRKAAGVSDEELDAEELQKLADEETTHKTRKAKKGKFQNDWEEDAFGPNASAHANRIVLPRASNLEMTTEGDFTGGQQAHK